MMHREIHRRHIHACVIGGPAFIKNAKFETAYSCLTAIGCRNPWPLILREFIGGGRDLYACVSLDVFARGGFGIDTASWVDSHF